MSRSIPLSRTPAQSRGGGPPGGSRTDGHLTLHARADYIHDLTDELRRMADEAGFELLAYILDMAHIEAGHIKRRTAPPEASPRDED